MLLKPVTVCRRKKRNLLAALPTWLRQPSRVESLGLVLLEAWANAKPVIAADIAVSRELVTSCDGGVLVPFGDATVLAQQIARLLNNDQLRRSMGQRGQAFAQNYDGDKLWPRYAEEFERLALRWVLFQLFRLNTDVLLAGSLALPVLLSPTLPSSCPLPCRVR